MAKNRKVTISKKIKRAARRGGVSIDQRGHLQKSSSALPRTPPDNSADTNKYPQITIPNIIPVRKLAETMGQSPSDVVAKLFANGVHATINESVDFDTAAIIADEFNITVEKETIKGDATAPIKSNKVKLISRPPVVAVMGHVDHGKTTLLDTIRSANVVAGESGGITQHIGAYSVEVKFKEKGKQQKRRLTFLDTPGHEAFSTMRAHGANVTDIVVLVVAADDGVKPQTIEAISHARAAGVPIIVAINKIDKPEANPEKVKRELSDQNLVPEECGGKTSMIPVSAKKNTGIETLLETICLTADLMDYKAVVNQPSTGIVIESKTKPGLGPTATILIQSGTLKIRDHILIDDQIGKVKTMEDENGLRLKMATPSMPVQISGFKRVPQAGRLLQSTSDEKTAKEILESRLKENVVKSAITRSLGEVSRAIKQGKIKQLNLILKADVQGSLEAIKNSLSDIKSDEVGVNFVSAGIGDITESDVNLATTSRAIIIAFNIGVPPQIKRLADSQGIQISRYTIIYELIDEIKSALRGLLVPEIVETEVGKLKILKIFRRTQNDGIVGGLVTKGALRPNLKFNALRGDEKLGSGTIDSVKIGPDDVNSAPQNSECGVHYQGALKFKPDDIIEAYQVEEIVKTIK